MFKIYGGATELKQWSLDQKLSMKDLPVGADIEFYNDPGEDDPLITEVYEFEGSKVCDIPNIMLQDTRRIKVRIPETVTGAYGVVYKYAGGVSEKFFKVVAAEKPVDYVYTETPTKGCGCTTSGSGGEVSDEKIEAAVEKYIEENGLTIDVPEGGTAIWAEFVD